MSRKETVKKANPKALEDGFLVDLIEAADSAHDIKAIADQPGGKKLVELLLKDVVNSVNVLAAKYHELSHIEMIAECARLNERRTLAKAIMNAGQKEEELDEAIKDALAE